MLIDDTKLTTYYTICAVLLRELRVQRGMHGSQFGDFLGKPTSAWEGIETGKTRLDFDNLLRICRGTLASPGQVLQAADAYEGFLRSHRWTVVLTDVGSGADGLRKRATEYWQSHGSRARDNGTAPMYQTFILSAPYFRDNWWYELAPVFQYAVDEQFRAQQSDPENFKPLPPSLDLQVQATVTETNTDGSNG